MLSHSLRRVVSQKDGSKANTIWSIDGMAQSISSTSKPALARVIDHTVISHNCASMPGSGGNLTGAPNKRPLWLFGTLGLAQSSRLYCQPSPRWKPTRASSATSIDCCGRAIQQSTNARLTHLPTVTSMREEFQQIHPSIPTHKPDASAVIFVVSVRRVATTSNSPQSVVSSV